MIHGGVPVDEREQAIDDFLERSDVPLLLTLEVGGEGIDLQKASVVINYDLPWNPMVVEQRIGRVARDQQVVGASSPKHFDPYQRWGQNNGGRTKIGNHTFRATGIPPT